MTTPFILGREEWLSLPDLGLVAIKAKVDTGARTSSLHAFDIAPAGPAGAPEVRFRVHPLPGRQDVEIACRAPLVDRRVVTSSNGERELRFIIRASVAMGGRLWPIDISLTNRERMAYRMLLGRQALQDDMLVRPGVSFLQPKLGARSYKDRAGAERPARESSGLAFAILTRRPDSASSRQLADAAAARGHAVAMLDRSRVSLFVDPSDPAMLSGGGTVGRIDAVIARSGARLGPFSLAILRHLELTGAATLNPAAALRQIADPLAVRQVLAAAHLPVAPMAASYRVRAGEGAGEPAILADGAHVTVGARLTRLVIVGADAAAALQRPRPDPQALAASEQPWARAELAEVSAEADIAVAAAHVLGLRLAAIDIARTPAGPLVLDITPAPTIALTSRVCGVPLAERIVGALEEEVRSGWSG